VVHFQFLWFFFSYHFSTLQSKGALRIDGRTIKRGTLIGQLDHLVSLGVGIHAYAFRPSAHSVKSD
jgi:hypothetical protein